MVKISEISNRETLEGWLRDNPNEWSIAIAARAAVRAFPVWLAWMRNHIGKDELDSALLQVFQSLLVSTVIARIQPNDFEHFANAARSAAAKNTRNTAATVVGQRSKDIARIGREVAALDAAKAISNAAAAARSLDASDAANAVVNSNNAFSDHDFSAWENVRLDCTCLESGQNLMRYPLWWDENNPSKGELADVNKALDADWTFWNKWFEGEVNGSPMHNALLLQVAKIVPDEWSKGPIHVNPIIHEMWRGFSETSSVREDLRRLNDEVEKLSTKIREQEADLGGLESAAQEASKRIETWMDGLNNRFDAKINAAIEALEQQAVFNEPIKLWKEKEAEHKKRKDSAYRWYWVSLLVVGIGVTLVFALAFLNVEELLKILSKPNCDTTNPQMDCSMGGIFEFLPLLILLTLITLALWFVRLKMKEFLSERHLELDARERRAFAEAYVRLVAADDGDDEARDQRAIVYASLFRPSTDGMVKDEGSLDPSISAAISKLLSR